MKEYDADGRYMVYVHRFSYDDNMCRATPKVTIYPGSGRSPQVIEMPHHCGTDIEYWLVGCFNSETSLNSFKVLNEIMVDEPDGDWCDL